MAERYTYRPLDNERSEIRLLAFEPHSHVPWEPQPSPIRCRVRYTSLEDETVPPYNAVSYCWGESRARRQILLDGKLHGIPESADIALRSLGQTSEILNTLIWIDAICIDQANLYEKSQQVARMGDTYSGAETVLIWLGESDDSTPSAIRSLYEIVEFCEPQEAGLNLKTDYTPADVVDLPSPPHCDWPSITHFFRAPWFTRTWVLQECKLAKTAVCYRGRFCFPWDIVGVAARMIWERAAARGCVFVMDDAYGSAFRGLYASGALHEFGSGMTEAAMFVSLLGRNAATDCTDPKDRIFAHLALLNRTEASDYLPVADYTLSLETIYTDATRAIMNTHKTLYPVAWAPCSKPGHAEITSEPLPSWVPHYDRLSRLSTWVAGIASVLHMAASPSRDSKFASNDSGVLYASGVCLGRVTLVGCQIGSMPPASSDLSQEDWPRYVTLDRIRDGMLAPWDAALSQGTCRSTKDAMEMASLFSLGRAAGQYESSPERSPLADFTALLRDCSISYRGDLDDAFHELLRVPPLNSADAAWSMDCMGNGLLGRHYFETSSAFKGLGVGSMKRDDVLCILCGCNKPLILRKRSSGWEIVGIAYVQGIMQADDIQPFLDSGWLEEEHHRVFEIH